MPLSYNAGTSCPSTEPLPEIIILDDKGFGHLIEDLEQALGQEINRDALLREVVECLKRDDSAELELEYLCLDKAQSEHQPLYGEGDVYLQGIRELGQAVRQSLHYHRLYRRGEMPYVMLRPCYRGVVLMRQDEYRRRLKQELDEEARAEFIRLLSKKAMADLSRHQKHPPEWRDGDVIRTRPLQDGGEYDARWMRFKGGV